MLEEIIKILFCLQNQEKNTFSEDCYKNAEIIRSRFSKIKRLFPDFFDSRDDILLDPESINYIIHALKDFFKTKKSKSDIISDCYEVFIGNHIRGQAGAA